MLEYKPVKDIEPEEINEQIDIRYKLIKNMIGNLYPNILYREIDTLHEIKAELLGEGSYGIRR